MKKKTLWIIVIVAVVAIFVLWLVKGYNHMVVEQENVETAWSQVENQYQRRMDLIPNLVNTVKGAVKTEHDNLTDVIEARAKATQVTVDASNLTEEQLKAFAEAQGQVSQALGRLLAVAESYPELKTNQNYQNLMTQLEGTENRITVARNTFNETARTYNTYIRRFPNNIVASMFSFEKRPYFEAEAGAEKAPVVSFD